MCCGAVVVLDNVACVIDNVAPVACNAFVVEM